MLNIINDGCMCCGFTNQHFYCLSVFTILYNIMIATLKPNTHRAVYVQQFVNLYSHIVDKLSVCLCWRTSLGLQRCFAIPSFRYRDQVNTVPIAFVHI